MKVIEILLHVDESVNPKEIQNIIDTSIDENENCTHNILISAPSVKTSRGIANLDFSCLKSNNLSRVTIAPPETINMVKGWFDNLYCGYSRQICDKYIDIIPMPPNITNFFKRCKFNDIDQVKYDAFLLSIKKYENGWDDINIRLSDQNNISDIVHYAPFNNLPLKF